MDKETSEIAKLTDRISKDPRSKLFVPLAEEYKKAGDSEMAIHVLLEGLKNNPEYVTARSSLGKLLMAKGDLSGAQKEFEEVVKAVPDNLMARKKLGDLFILQDRPLDALPHYKIAQSLNPGDEELASLISDVEAGRDVSSKIPAFKAKTTAPEAVKQEPPASIADHEPAPAADLPQTPNIEATTPVETQSVPQVQLMAPAAETAEAPTSSATETEEPEEVLVVEPLEPETFTQEPPAVGEGLPGEQELRAEPAVVGEETIDLDFSTSAQSSDELVVSQDIRSGTELFNVEDRGTIPTAASEEIVADEIVETAVGEGVLEEIPQSSSEDISGKSDDFTTDTLAELYISQGFFEKAIEIYERMLDDKPGSRGLQNKLRWVRAAAARMGTPASEQEKEAEDLSAQEAREYVPAAEAGEAVAEPQEERGPQRAEDMEDFLPEAVTEAGEDVPTIEPEELFIEAEVVAEPDEFGPEKKSSEENIIPDFRDYTFATEPKVRTTAGEDAGLNIKVASPVPAEDGSKRDFEPREYLPPDREREPLEPTSKNENITHGPLSARRMETIARLETWLTTIKKEK
jgi:tetratricopeptide (TPR) repeat protein